VDNPEIKTNANESTEMPFRYVVGKDGEPIMPPVSCFMQYSQQFPVLTLAGHG